MVLTPEEIQKDLLGIGCQLFSIWVNILGQRQELRLIVPVRGPNKTPIESEFWKVLDLALDRAIKEILINRDHEEALSVPDKLQV